MHIPCRRHHCRRCCCHRGNVGTAMCRCLITMSPSLSSPWPSQLPLPKSPSLPPLPLKRRNCPCLNLQRSGVAVPLPLLMALLSLSSSSLLSLSTPIAPLMLSLMLTTLLVLFAPLQGALGQTLDDINAKALKDLYKTTIN